MSSLSIGNQSNRSKDKIGCVSTNEKQMSIGQMTIRERSFPSCLNSEEPEEPEEQNDLVIRTG